jgi:hypothetical protein
MISPIASCLTELRSNERGCGLLILAVQVREEGEIPILGVLMVVLALALSSIFCFMLVVYPHKLGRVWWQTNESDVQSDLQDERQ